MFWFLEPFEKLLRSCWTANRCWWRWRWGRRRMQGRNTGEGKDRINIWIYLLPKTRPGWGSLIKHSRHCQLQQPGKDYCAKNMRNKGHHTLLGNSPETRTGRQQWSKLSSCQERQQSSCRGDVLADFSLQHMQPTSSIGIRCWKETCHPFRCLNVDVENIKR